MANELFLDGTQQTISVGFDANITGTAAAETVLVQDGADVSFGAQSGDRVDLAQDISNYTIERTGLTELTLTDGSGEAITLTVNQGQPFDLRFQDGNATVDLTSNGVEITGGSSGTETLANTGDTANTGNITLGSENSQVGGGGSGGASTGSNGSSATPVFSISDDPAFDGLRSDIQDAASQGLDAWFDLIQPKSDMDVEITIDAVDSSALALGGSSYFESDALPDGGVPSVFASEVITGTDTNGAEADVRISLSRQNLSELSFDAVAADEISAVSVFTHEIGHALGFSSFRNNPDTDIETIWDTFLDTDGSGNLVFDGLNARAANRGAPIPLDDPAHFNEDRFGTAMMTPEAERVGGEQITSLEVAVLRDLGFSLDDSTELIA